MDLFRIFKSALVLFLGLGLTMHSVAQQSPAPTNMVSPIGYWQTIDDEQGDARSIVKIFAYQGKLYGRIMQVNFRQGESSQDVCGKCTDARKNQPILGLVIMSGYVQNSDAPTQWSDGQIVDPHSGNTYSSQLTLVNNGNTLKMLGYMGSKLFGRTQTWQRLPATALSAYPADMVAQGSDAVAVQKQLGA